MLQTFFSMKLSPSAFRSTRLSAILFVLASGAATISSSLAQENGQPAPSAQPGAGPSARAAGQQLAFTEAAALYRARNPAAAEERLFRANHRPPGTVGWQIESASKLTQMALVLRQEYDFPGSTALAMRALAVLDAAAQPAQRADARQQAVVHEMSAFLLEELLRDSESARVAYQKARQANPASKRATQGLARLDEEQAKIQRLTGNR
jgi:hypothetical protein